MVTDVLLRLALAAFITGVALHLGIFIRGEYIPTVLHLFRLATLGPPVLIALSVFLFQNTIQDAFLHVSLLTFSFWTGLLSSILTYRVFFHPLRNIPGPFFARLTQFWFIFANRDLRSAHFLADLHAQYGGYVRTGPNQISVLDPDIMDLVHGPRSTCTKSDWYDRNYPMTTLQQFRDKAQHERRRRGGWDKAFNIKSMRAYDSRVQGYADLLLSKLSEKKGKPVDASMWCTLMTYDIMGELAFSRSFNALESGEYPDAIKIMHKNLVTLGLLGYAPWFLHLMTKLVPANPIVRFLEWSARCVQDRRNFKPAEPDIFHHLLEGEPFYDDPKKEQLLLVGDSRLVIIAGSDTTAVALTFMIYHLAQDPDVVEKIRAELAENDIHNAPSVTVVAVQNLTYLNAVINETLRLHPPVPGGVYRNTPPSGLVLPNGTHIRGNVNILTPTYPMQTSSKAFTEPQTFIPERWTTKPNLVLKKDAFAPFLLGTYGCIGKQLALAELRTVISKLILEFDITLAPGETGRTLWEESKDSFTVILAPLQICFKQRDVR